MTLAQLLRLAATLIARLRTERSSNPNPVSANPQEPKIPPTSSPHSWIGVSLNKDMHDALETLARDKNLTIEELMRHAINEFLHNRPRE